MATVKPDDPLSPLAPPSRFRCSQFCQQLPVQVFFPFSLPFACLLCSPGFALNAIGVARPFSWAGVGSFLISFCQAMPLLCAVFWALSSPLASTVAAATLRADLIHVLVVAIVFRVAVTVKYAYIPPAVYRRRLREWAPTAERRGEQLISGWQYLTPEKVRAEVGAAAEREPMDARPLFFLLHGDAALARLRAELRCGAAGALVEGAAVERGAGAAGGGRVLAVPCVALTEAIILAAERESAAYARAAGAVNFGVSLAATAATAVLRAACGVPQLGDDVYQLLVIVTHWVANAFLLGAALVFLNVGAVDHFRRARSNALLGGLFTVPRGGVGSASAAPALDLTAFENTRAFLAARRLLASFGDTYHERLVIITAISLAFYAAVAAYVLVVLVSAPPGGLGVMLSPFILLHVLVAPAFACILAGLLQAARANREMHGHVAVVVEAAVRARLALEGGGAQAGRAPPCFALLKDAERLLRATGEAAAIKILGFEVTPTLVKSFLGAWVSLETACVYQLLQKGF
jgi:hypothetical protein